MKKRKNVFILLLSFILISIHNISLAIEPNGCLSEAEVELAQLINNYRNENGLPSVPISQSLTAVAQWHVIDLHENIPDTGSDHGFACNMHSWSGAQPTLWSAVCYTSDHQYAQGMWNKPREITSNVYWGNGFENAYGSIGQASATGSFNSWTNSPPHDAVILETGIWDGMNFPAMGVGIYEHHAVLWFGDQADPQGTAVACGSIGSNNFPLSAILYLLLR